jgi:hypothetical protein
MITQTGLFFLIGCFLCVVWQFWVSISFLFTKIKNTTNKMGELKIGLWLLQTSGFGLWFWGIVNDWGDFKSVSLFVVAIIFAGYKIGNAHLDYMRKKSDFQDYMEERKSKKMNKKLDDTGKNK